MNKAKYILFLVKQNFYSILQLLLILISNRYVDNYLFFIIVLFIVVLEVIKARLNEREKQKEKINELLKINKEKENDYKIFLTIEQDNYIKQIEVYIIFDKEYYIKDLVPCYFGYEIYNMESDLNIREVLVTNGNLSSNKGLMLSYKIYDVKIGGNEICSSDHGVFTYRRKFLDSQISLPPNKYRLRDINNSMLMFYIDERLVKISNRIVLKIGNYLYIDENIPHTAWEKIDDIATLCCWEKYALQNRAFYRISADFTSKFTYHPWRIDLYNRNNRNIQSY